VVLTYTASNILCTKYHVPFALPRLYQGLAQAWGTCILFITRPVFTVRCCSTSTPSLEDHPLSAVCDCLFNVFAATLHIGGRSSICIAEDVLCHGDRTLSSALTLFFTRIFCLCSCFSLPGCQPHIWVFVFPKH